MVRACPKNGVRSKNENVSVEKQSNGGVQIVDDEVPTKSSEVKEIVSPERVGSVDQTNDAMAVG